jgi:hypothetical protein
LITILKKPSGKNYLKNKKNAMVPVSSRFISPYLGVESGNLKLRIVPYFFEKKVLHKNAIKTKCQ